MLLNFHTTVPHVVLKLQWQDEHTDSQCLSTVRQDESDRKTDPLIQACRDERSMGRVHIVEQRGANDKERFINSFRDSRKSAERKYNKRSISHATSSAVQPESLKLSSRLNDGAVATSCVVDTPSNFPDAQSSAFCSKANCY